jgi:two-component system copper resistance phosphate regulon response regulator CusR
MRLLIAEDEPALASFLQKGLEAECHSVDVARDGQDARSMAEDSAYDLMILDLTLPLVDGIEVLKQVRMKKTALPILVLTARNRVEDRVTTLDLGADDYLIKPFSFAELLARVRALLRRRNHPQEGILQVGDLEMNRVERTVKRSGKLIDLTPKEFALLEYLMLHADRRVTRAMIIDHVWNLSFDTMTNVVDVYINYLRKKIEPGTSQRMIRTIRGVGYQLGGVKQAG